MVPNYSLKQTAEGWLRYHRAHRSGGCLAQALGTAAMPGDTVEKLEQAFLPHLQMARDILAAEFPAYEFKVGSSSIGGRTSYQGHNIWLECTFPSTPHDLADTVAIVIGIKLLTTTPQLCEASVEWGHGEHPDISLDLLPDPVPFSIVHLDSISSRLEKLVTVFRSAVASGPGRVSA